MHRKLGHVLPGSTHVGTAFRSRTTTRTTIGVLVVFHEIVDRHVCAVARRTRTLLGADRAKRRVERHACRTLQLDYES